MRYSLTSSCVIILTTIGSLVGTSQAPASIVPMTRFSYVTVDTEVTDSESTDFDNDYNDTSDFLPYAGSVQALALVGVESCAAEATQTSSMDALSVRATGEASATFIEVAMAAGSGIAESNFMFAFDIDQAGTYEFSADVLGQAFGSYSLLSTVALKGPSGSLAELTISDVGSDEILPVLISLSPGSYSLEARAEVTIGEPDSEVSASFNANLVFVVPEPGTLGLLCTGLMLIRRRRAF